MIAPFDPAEHDPDDVDRDDVWDGPDPDAEERARDEDSLFAHYGYE